MRRKLFHMSITSDRVKIKGRPFYQFRLGKLTSIQELVRNIADGKLLSDNEFRNLGELLYEMLFDPALEMYFRQILFKTRSTKNYIKVVLEFDEIKNPEIAALPWEFLRAPEISGFPSIDFATDPNISLIRFRSSGNTDLTRRKINWKILVTVARPSDCGEVVYSDLLQEINELTKTAGDSIKLLPVLENQLSRNSFDNELKKHAPDILHFIGHGKFILNDFPQGQIALVGSDGSSEWLSDEDFVTIIERHLPKVLFLQACESGKLDSIKGFTGVASKAIQHGLPAVIAMQYPISNNDALIFTREFYQQFFSGIPVDKAVQEGRRALSNKNRNRFNVCTPVLFMSTEIDIQIKLNDRKGIQPSYNNNNLAIDIKKTNWTLNIKKCGTLYP